MTTEPTSEDWPEPKVDFETGDILCPICDDRNKLIHNMDADDPSKKRDPDGPAPDFIHCESENCDYFW